MDRGVGAIIGLGLGLCLGLILGLGLVLGLCLGVGLCLFLGLGRCLCLGLVLVLGFEGLKSFPSWHKCLVSARVEKFLKNNGTMGLTNPLVRL